MRWLFGLWPADQIAIHPFEADHVHDAAQIHAANFARPWTDGEIATLSGRDGVFGFVARGTDWWGTATVGFVLARMAADEAEILTIAVKPDWQGYGVGRRLMDGVLTHAYRERIASVFLEVDETNAAARALYQRLGFVTVGDRPDYYAGADAQKSRAIVMRRDAPARRAWR
ncbi:MULTISPECIES: ribosomal protein S18-alanine N-acetyltransferase [unclassified Roseitalea]|uniref:ribosomal protein S18-alanine N-acetyltransferase n=1 Tax=unclassified Roseitalea TaxID=2639107 RepID=UPI00273D6588|nr:MULTISPECIES: ribosomal protein S18-alanine N-acetyltransferase [unclassified Roseitalea]